MENGCTPTEAAMNDNEVDDQSSNSAVEQSSPDQHHVAVQQPMHAQQMPPHVMPIQQQQQQQQHQHPPQQFPPQQFPPAQRFGPPQGMPQGPPRPMGPNNELWIETKTEEGKSYYYHSITRQTTWSRPTGPNVQVMTQAEVENLQKQQMQKREPVGMPGMPGMGPPQGQMPPFGAPPFFSGPPPFMMPPPNFQQPAPQQAFPWGNIHPQQWLAIKAKDVDAEIDPQLLARAAEWTEHKAPDGRPYYYNASKNESVWEKPEVMRQVEEMKAAAANRPKQPTVMNPVSDKDKVQNNALSFDSLGNANFSPTKAKAEEEERKKKLEAEKRKKEQEEKAKKPQDKSRPISSTPIAGTPWCVVWTGDGRVFFYNPSTRTSLWERPPELANRPDVDKAIKTLPEALLTTSGFKSDTKTEESNKVQEAIKQSKKRSDTESSDSEPELNNSINKKIKLEETKLPSANNNTANNEKEEVMDAEMKAAKERATVPLEQRVKQFKEMLREKDVSAFSTWEKELHKIVFDPRYLLLTSRERKQVFERYVKDRAEEERREKRNKLRQKREDFRTLMENANLHGKSSFDDFAKKYSKDEHFRAIEKMRERESLFNEYIVEVRKREKEDKHQKKEQIRKDFFDLLRENDIDRHQRWSDVKKKIDDKDSRYKAVGDSITREDYFHDYCKMLKDEKKKREKEKKKSNKDKDRKEESTKKRRSSERSTGDKDSGEKEDNKTGKEDKDADDDEDHKSDTDKEDGEHPGTDNEEEPVPEKRMKRTAEEAIKDREMEVQKALASQMRFLDKERENHKRDEAVRVFNALLVDLVKTDVTWKESKKALKKDSRYDMADMLSREEKETLFEEHINTLSKKKRDKFREMLEELPQFSLTSSWKEIKRLIRDDPRYLKFNSSEKCEREFRDYVKDKTMLAKTSFRELLSETKLITHKSYEMVRENPNHLKEIEEILKNDKRYLDLDHLHHERSSILNNYLEDLMKRGPPPPPTATNRN
ncbi:transcription elongation regulator 1 isoform X2 [Culicoides brevitarsis]|uniref:transcription elongation regulator 1 isoform X2 n=1 Tax=Culicoides brevitarsis TaxID=469753 RepID=UPI00307BAF63